MSIPSISIPFSKSDLWLDTDSSRCIYQWHKNICERRKKKTNELKKLKERFYNSKKSKGNIFKLIANQDSDYESKVWKQVFLEFREENIHPDDDLYNQKKKTIFDLFM